MPVCSARTQTGKRCHRHCVNSKCWQHGSGKKKSSQKPKRSRSKSKKESKKELKGRNLTNKEVIYYMRGLIKARKMGWISSMGKGKGIKIKTDDPKVLDLVENVLIRQEEKFERESPTILIIKTLSSRSYVYLGIMGEYVIWMKPHLEDLLF